MKKINVLKEMGLLFSMKTEKEIIQGVVGKARSLPKWSTFRFLLPWEKL